MSVFLIATLAVAVAEIGDKTQLLALFLTLRFANKKAIIAGIFLATLLNHWLSALLGVLLASWLPMAWLQLALGLSFIGLGLWLLVPDKDSSPSQLNHSLGAFLLTFLLFSWAELGDKTQLATVMLAARFDDWLWVLLGSTLGMMLANVPVVLWGQKMLQFISMTLAHRLAAGLFIILGLATVLGLFMPAGVVSFFP